MNFKNTKHKVAVFCGSMYGSNKKFKELAATVTKLKESKDEIIDHERITHILRSVQSKAKRNKIDPEIIVRIWQIFIQEAIKLESSKIKK